MKAVCVVVMLFVLATAARSAEATVSVCGRGYVKSMQLDPTSKDGRLRLFVAMDSTGFKTSDVSPFPELVFVHPVEQKSEHHWELLVKMVQAAMLARSPVLITSGKFSPKPCADIRDEDVTIKVCTDHESCN